MIAGLKPYPAMKDSGAGWLGPIPSHWELRRTKTLLRERVQKGFPAEPLLAATQTKGVVRKDRYENRTVLALKDLHLLKLVRIDDFVISLRSFQGGIEYAREQGIISPAYTILHPIVRGMHGYLARLFKSKPYIENLLSFVTGIRQGQNVDYERLSRSTLPLPPPSEQAAIVRFLDHYDRMIRRYIRAKQKLIALLEEQKQAIIHRAVTGQIDVRTGKPYPRYKPSGVEWLGDVPEGWEVRRAKHLFRAVTRRDVHGDETKLSVTQRHGLVPTEEMEENSTQASTFERFQVCVPGDLVLNKYKAHLGVFWAAHRRGLITPNYTVFRPVHPMVTAFFELLFHTRTYRDAFTMAVYGVTEGMSPLYTQDFYAVPALCPLRPEQEYIVAEVTKATAKENTAVSRVEHEISLFREYRTRLIADVVTGKLDVREAAANLPDEPDEPEPLDEADDMPESDDDAVADAADPEEGDT